jgi:hypothetical protein
MKIVVHDAGVEVMNEMCEEDLMMKIQVGIPIIFVNMNNNIIRIIKIGITIRTTSPGQNIHILILLSLRTPVRINNIRDVSNHLIVGLPRGIFITQPLNKVLHVTLLLHGTTVLTLVVNNLINNITLITICVNYRSGYTTWKK